MSKRPEENKLSVIDGAMGLKTRIEESHNHAKANERLIRLVEHLARRAAEADFMAYPPHHPDQGEI